MPPKKKVKQIEGRQTLFAFSRKTPENSNASSTSTSTESSERDHQGPDKGPSSTALSAEVAMDVQLLSDSDQAVTQV